MSVKRALIILWFGHRPTHVIRKKPVTVDLPLPVIRLAAPLEVAKNQRAVRGFGVSLAPSRKIPLFLVQSLAHFDWPVRYLTR
jgi:hypothetical protein